MSALNVILAGAEPAPVPARARGGQFRNFLYLLGGRGGGVALNALTAVYLARCLGPLTFGYFGLAQSVTVQVLLVTDLGLVLVGVREAARAGRVGSNLFAAVVRIRLALSLVALVGAMAVAALWHTNPDTRWLIAGFAPAALGMAFSLDWAFQGIESMIWVAIPGLLRTGSFLLLSILLVRGPGQLLRLPWCYLSGYAAAVAIAFWAARRSGRIHFGWKADPATQRALITSAVPIGLAALLAVALQNVDLFFINRFHPGAAVGIYYAAYRVFLASLLVTIALTDAVFPHLSNRLAHSPEALGRWLAKLWSPLLALILPMPVIAWAWSGPAVRLVFGSRYAAAAIPLALLISAVPLLNVTGIANNVLIAAGWERHYATCMVIILATTVVLDSALVARWSIIGAAIAQIGGQMAGFGYSVGRMRHHVRTPGFAAPALRIAAMVASSALAGFALAWISRGVATVAASLVYLALLWLTGALHWPRPRALPAEG